MARTKLLVSWPSEWWCFVFTLTPFASNLSYFYVCDSEYVLRTRIRILKVAKTDPIWIQMHDAAYEFIM